MENNKRLQKFLKRDKKTLTSISHWKPPLGDSLLNVLARYRDDTGSNISND